MQYESRWLGTVEYGLASELQKTLAARVGLSGCGVILGLEHPEVITLGIRGEPEDILIPSEIPVYRAERGGQATYHNPGQLVIYPICPVKKWGLRAKEWVEILSEITKNSLEMCNIIVVSQTSGVFTGYGKIASVGLNLKGGVSTHGIAINISNDLSGFSRINACGVQKQSMDRVGNYLLITPESFFSIWCEQFNKVFSQKGDSLLTSQAPSL